MAQGGPAAMAGRTHLSPSRTQKLSAPAADIVERQSRHAAGQPALLSSVWNFFFYIELYIICIMNLEDEKKLKQKIYIVIALCVIIIIAFIILIIRNSYHKPVDINPQDSTVSVVTPTPDTYQTEDPNTEPSQTIVPEETVIPEITVEPEETAQPDDIKNNDETVENDQNENASDIDVYTDSSIYRIVNMEHLIDKNYVPKNLKSVNVPQIGTQLLREEAVKPLEEMFQAARKDNISLYLISGYRSYALQYSLWETYKARYGIETAKLIDAYPGSSEHQTGLSVDLGGADRKCELKGCFYDTQTYKWLHEHSYEYGFIERNPSGSEKVTGVQASPWNYRYVGKEEAEKIYKSGLTMEEYYKINSAN